jgi:transposase-like protein
MGICRAGWAETDIAELALDFLLSAKQDAAAVKRFLAKALGRRNHPVPRVINTDKHAYPAGDCATQRRRCSGVLEENCQHRPPQYLNNVLKQDHRAIAWRTIAGYEAVHRAPDLQRPSGFGLGPSSKESCRNLAPGTTKSFDGPSPERAKRSC